MTRNPAARSLRTSTSNETVKHGYAAILRENSKAFTVATKHPFSPGLLAACKDADPNLFDPADMAALEKAKTYCASCPVRDLCEQAGLARDEWGVWGGVLLENGVARDEPRKMGRPRKARNEPVPA